MNAASFITKNKKSINRSELGALLRNLLLPSFRHHRFRLLVGFASLLLVDFLQLIIPRILKMGVDGLAKQTITGGGLGRLALVIFAIATIVILLRFAWRYCIIGFSRLLEQAIRDRIFAHMLDMDAPFFEKRTTGDLMAHSSNDLSAVQMACGMGMVAAVDAFVMSIAAIGFMVTIHPTLTCLALLPMPLLAIATRILSGKLHRRFTAVQEQFSLLTEFSRSTLISVGLIKAYTMEALQTTRFDSLGKKYVASNLRVAAIQGLISPLATMVGSFGMLMVLYFGGRLVIAGTISLGDFVAFISYLYMLIWPMMAIGWVANLVQRGLTSLQRIHDLVTSRPLLPNPPLPSHVTTTAAPDFKLAQLSFTYPSSASPALKSLTLDLRPGIYGITGRTGSGKSTLCKILARIYPIPDHSLYFCGHDVNRLPLDFVRQQLGYVSQEPVLFSETISANISLGKPEASVAEIEEAARQAAVHQDIIDLDAGYQTRIGERGVKLSGGQRQRLALARALLCDRPVLIIDDGLSAVDVATEHTIFANLKRHFTGKTVIVVSNRIKLLSMTDEIIILDNGIIVARGDHDHLLAENTLYQAMYTKQAKQDEQEPQA
jgi:ATP-binding cassette subfamily B multidrug efflux pump